MGSFSELSEDELSSLYPDTTHEDKDKPQESDGGKKLMAVTDTEVIIHILVILT